MWASYLCLIVASGLQVIPAREVFLEGRPPEHPEVCESARREFPGFVPGVDIMSVPVEHTAVCPLDTGDVVSVHAGQQTTAYFENTAGVRVSVLYVDTDGTEHLQKLLEPGGMFPLNDVS